MAPETTTGLSEQDWATLLDRIADGKCTPFLGAGVNGGLLPLGSTVANAWAKEFVYPFKNTDALDQVAEFIAIQSGDPMMPKEKFLKLLRARLSCLADDQLEETLLGPTRPLGVLARLPLPVYITTNYDDLLTRALIAQKKHPRREPCRWNRYVKKHRSTFDQAGGFVPDADNPVVFHLHGQHDIAESLVLTEDDYLDFLVTISRGARPRQSVLPARIEEALTGASLLFIGYRLTDINFRVMFRALVCSLEDSLRRINVSVQLAPEGPGQERYLQKYFESFHVRVLWETADEFARQLADRWARHPGAP